MKKSLIRIFIVILWLIINQNVLGQGPPDPPENPGSGGGPVGGAAPLNNGESTLILFITIYATWKVKSKKTQLFQQNQPLNK